MINHFMFRDFNGKKLITNDLGMYAFLSDSEFNLLLSEKLDKNSELYSLLLEKFFIYENKEVFLQRIRDVARYSKNYLLSSTSLFIFVVTNKCNANCLYCQAKDSTSVNNGLMSKEIAEKAVDIALDTPSKYLNFEFQGGEPLINFSTIKHIVEYTKSKTQNSDKHITFSLVTNLTLLDDEIADFLKDNGISVSTSLDGDRDTHNYNRPLFKSDNSFDLVIEKINYAREKGLCIGAIETTTAKTLNRYKELIDTYVEHSIGTVFIRPLTPLGVAKERWDTIGYDPDEYISFYRNAINYMLELNKQGIKVSEGHARLFLSKMLFNDGVNYMELRSPCGASIGQMAFYHDGRVFTCDEGRMLAEMGNAAFQLGTISNTYNELINSSVCKTTCTSSILECLPACCDCPFSPYCGTCPVINLAYDGDVFAKTPRNYRCRVYEGMISVLFEILQRNNETELEILKSWIKGE